MTKHGNTIQKKNGFQLVELVNMEADGSVSIVGYAILCSGKEVSRFSSWEEAIAAFAELSDDSAPPPPRESSGPSFG